MFDRLPFRRRLPGVRTLKSALAVALAWWVASTFLGEERPVFAAIGAFWAMEETIFRSARRTGYQLVGVAGGALLAFVGVQVVGIGALLVGLAVLLGLGLGRLAGSERVGIELSITALLVVGLAEGNLGYGWTRLWETGLGGLVSIVVNALVLPPDHVGCFRRDFDRLAREAAADLREAAEIFATRPNHEGAAELRATAKAMRDTLPHVEADLDLATEALRLNPLRRAQLADLERYRAGLSLFGRAIIHATTLARIIDDHARSDHPWPHGGLEGPNYLLECAEAVARTLEHKRQYVLSGDERLLDTVKAELERGEAAIREFLVAADRERGAQTDVRRIIDVAAIAAELSHLVGDIRGHLDASPVAARRPG